MKFQGWPSHHQDIRPVTHSHINQSLKSLSGLPSISFLFPFIHTKVTLSVDMTNSTIIIFCPAHCHITGQTNSSCYLGSGGWVRKTLMSLHLFSLLTKPSLPLAEVQTKSLSDECFSSKRRSTMSSKRMIIPSENFFSLVAADFFFSRNPDSFFDEMPKS